MGKRSRAKRREQVELAPPVGRVPLTKQSKWNGSDVPDVSDADCAFPTRWRELLPPVSDLTDDERRVRGPFCDALSSIFYRGGKLADGDCVDDKPTESRYDRNAQASKA